MPLHLAQHVAADAFLDEDPFALLLGMMLDQQIPMEKAFFGPWLLADRLGVQRLDPAEIAHYDVDTFGKIFAGPPAIHRFPAAMAARTQALATAVVEHYNGDAAAIWTDVSSGERLLTRLNELPGFGEQKAQIFLALLGKQRGVRPRGWRASAGGFGEDGSYRSVADVTSDESLQKVRAFKKEMKAAVKRTASKPAR